MLTYQNLCRKETSVVTCLGAEPAEENGDVSLEKRGLIWGAIEM
jgi:hypothetical protein